MITIDKVIEIFCATDEFCKNLELELSKNLQIAPIKGAEKRTRNRKGCMSKSEIMAILLYFHFGTFRNFKHDYLTFVKGYMKSYFPTAVSYNRFVELMPRVFFELMVFLRVSAFGKCSGISFVDSTMVPVCLYHKKEDNLKLICQEIFDSGIQQAPRFIQDSTCLL